MTGEWQILAFVPGGAGIPLPPWASVTLGIFLVGLGLFMVARATFAYRPTKWKWRGGTRISRFGQLSWALVVLAFGGVIILSEHIHAISRRHGLWIILTTIGIFFIAGIFDGLMDGRKPKRMQNQPSEGTR